MSNEAEQLRMSRIRLDALVPSEVKGKIMAASKASKPPVKFNEWAINVLAAAADTTTSDRGFVVVMRGGVAHLSGCGFLVPLGCEREQAQSFVDYLNTTRN